MPINYLGRFDLGGDWIAAGYSTNADGVVPGSVLDPGISRPSYVTSFTAPAGGASAVISQTGVYPEALLRGPSSATAGDGFRASWLSGDSASMTAVFTTTQAVTLSVYFWDDFDDGGAGARVQTVELLDSDGTTVLDTRSVTAFRVGSWYRWELPGGTYSVRVTRTDYPGYAEVSAFLFEPLEEGGTTEETGVGGGVGRPAAALVVAATPPATASGFGAPSAVVQVLATPAGAAGGAGLPAAVVDSSSSVAAPAVAGGLGLPAAQIRVDAAPTAVAYGRVNPSAVVAVVTPGTGPQTLRAAVSHRLKGTTAITAMVGARILPGGLPQDATFPAVTFAVPSGSAGHHLQGSDGTATATVQISCWSYRLTDVDAAAEAVRRRFDGFRGWIGQVEVLSSLLDAPPYDLSEPPAKAGGAWLYRTTSEYSIKYRVPVPDQLEE